MGPTMHWLKGNRVWLLGGLVLLGIVACTGTATATLPPAATTPASAAPATSPAANNSIEGGNPNTPSSPEASPETNATPVSSLPAAKVPIVDRSIHSVPLEDIVFDTFGGSPRFLPLDRASDDDILALQVAIVPIAEPAYGGPGDLAWLEDDDLVIGYNSGDGPYAYPVNVLDFHEIVNDVIDGEPLLITYCPLCFSGVVFHRKLDGRSLTFGNTSALYQSDLVMYDYQTGSYWFQVGGEAVVGSLTGSRLDLLPSTTIAWGEWRDLYPDTRLLTGSVGSPEAFDNPRYGRGFSSDYQDRVNDDKFAFPVDADKLDGRLSSGEIVLTVEVDDAAVAFPLGLIGDAAANHEVGGLPVVVFSRDSNGLAVAFSRVVGKRTLTFNYNEDNQLFVDRETSSAWDVGGRAIQGPLAGAELEQLNTRRAFWFSIAIAFPNIDVYLP